MSFFSNNTSSTFARPTSFFNNLSSAGTTSTTQQQSTATNAANPMNAVEVPHAPDDTVQDLKFNPVSTNTPIFLAAGSWDNTVRIWQVNENGTVEAKAMQNINAPVLSIDWMEDSSKVFIAGADKQARVWDLASNQVAIVGTHDQPIRTCHWITSPQYSCLMTGSWDQTLKFWDMRQLPTQTSLATINLGQKVYCADVVYPMAVVGLSNRKVKIYSLDGQPKEHTEIETPLKYQMRCCSIFRHKMTNQPCGFAQGSIEGRVAIQYVEPQSSKDNFTFKCHRSPDLVNGFQEIYPVHDVAFHPQHYTLITVGADGRYSFWDKDARTKLKSSEQHQMPITKAHVHGTGNVFAYALGYDWCRGHELYQQGQGSKIFLLPCGEDLKPRKK
uniref:Mitotic checkpoint protein and poly(A)+ RNA export protein n=1 Tax=Panagrolaimus sp. PS1159 TaxID=55785 RepID=A0AC35F4N3_9BILA